MPAETSPSTAPHHAPPPVGVCLVTIGKYGLLRDCLESLADGEGWRCGAEVVVVDKSDEGGAKEALAGLPPLRIVRQTWQSGYGESANLAIAASRATHALLLDDDTVIHEGALEALLAHLDRNPRVVAVAPRVVGRDGAPQHTAWLLQTPRNSITFALTLGRRMVQSRTETTRSVEQASGVALVVRADALRRIGGFDPGYFLYFDDTDLCRRLGREGAIDLLPSATVTHMSHSSTSQSADRQLNEYWRSFHRYARLYHGPVGRAVMRVGTAAGYAGIATAAWALKRLPVAATRSPVEGVSPKVAYAQARGALLGPWGPGYRETADDWNRLHGATRPTWAGRPGATVLAEGVVAPLADGSRGRPDA
jgi:N-acetylglucosaminyl-diphospho-decaprenol L-rhamnosyltransferase